MHLQTLLLLATASLASLAAAAPASESENDVAIPAALVARACVKNGCACRSGIKAGIYCGACVISTGGHTGWAITKKFNQHHIYQCGSNGSCCDYGTATECGGSKGRCAQGSTP